MIQRVVDIKADVKLILTLRTEYYGRLLDHLRAGRRLFPGGAGRVAPRFLPAVVDRGDRTTDIAELPLGHGAAIAPTKYGFRFGEGVAAQIAEDGLSLRTEHQDSILPLIQVICTQTLRTEKGLRELGRDDYPRGTSRRSAA